MAATTSSGGRGRARGGMIVGINVTPMVDVVLVLLVIMMVTANFIVSTSMNVDLPKAANGDRMTPSVAIVSIGADGAYAWNDAAVDEGALTAHLRSAKAENPEVNLIVSGDSKSQHGRVVHVLDLAKAEGIVHFAIAVERE